MLHATPIFLTSALTCSAADYSVFVGDLAPDVTDYALQEHFRQFFASVRSAKVLPCNLPSTASLNVQTTDSVVHACCMCTLIQTALIFPMAFVRQGGHAAGALLSCLLGRK